ncbi:MAG: signal recognition particle-docking protein FtsY, partial [Glutamicibacter arilaitensis]
MSDSLILTIIIVAVVAVVAIGAIAFVTKGRKPKTPYTSERDADDLPAGQSAEGDTDAAADTAGASDAPVAVQEPAAPAAPQLDVPEPVQGRLARLRARLTKSNNMFSKGLLALLSQDSIDEDVWEEIEE